MDYSRLVDTYGKLGKTPARLKKVDTMASLFEESPPELLPKVALLVQGLVFPAWSEKELGIANQLMVKAISQASGFPEAGIVERFSRTGDLGLVIEELVGRKRQKTLAARKLTVEKVFENLQRIA